MYHGEGYSVLFPNKESLLKDKGNQNRKIYLKITQNTYGGELWSALLKFCIFGTFVKAKHCNAAVTIIWTNAHDSLLWRREVWQ